MSGKVTVSVIVCDPTRRVVAWAQSSTFIGALLEARRQTNDLVESLRSNGFPVGPHLFTEHVSVGQESS